jgi:uncharacterized membrane protein
MRSKVQFAFGVISFTFGLMMITSALEWYHYLFGILGLAVGSHAFYKYYTDKKNRSQNNILKERDDKGKISKEEFDKTQRDLNE